MRLLLAAYSFIIGLCFGSFALATAWRLKHKKSIAGSVRSVCEHCKHVLAPRDLIPLFSWLMARGKCRYCHTKLSGLFPLAELIGALFVTTSYLLWPTALKGAYNLTSFFIWNIALVLLLVLFFYDLQWFTLPNKVIYPLWVVAAADFVLRFAHTPTLKTLVMGVAAVAVAAGVFWLFWYLSKGQWIGYGDVRLGVAIGLFVATPALAALVIFVASVIGVLAALPGLITRSKKLTSKVPFGPLLIIALVLVKLLGQKTIDWYMAHLILF